MSIRDLLLPLIGDATRSTMGAIEKCVAMAAGRDARITALALETEADALPPTVADVLGATEIVQTAPAARAVGDALPLLRKARRVRIATATHDTTAAQRSSGAALQRHLREHGIEAQLDTIGIAGSSVGKVFEAYVDKNAIDLLV